MNRHTMPIQILFSSHGPPRVFDYNKIKIMKIAFLLDKEFGHRSHTLFYNNEYLSKKMSFEESGVVDNSICFLVFEPLDYLDQSANVPWNLLYLQKPEIRNNALRIEREMSYLGIPKIGQKEEKNMPQSQFKVENGIVINLINPFDLGFFEIAILAPRNSPYEGGKFYFSLHLSTQYPHMPPTLECITPGNPGPCFTFNQNKE